MENEVNLIGKELKGYKSNKIELERTMLNVMCNCKAE